MLPRVQPWRLARSVFPILRWYRSYDISTAAGDLIAGVTVALTLIPQSIAYAKLAGLPPQVRTKSKQLSLSLSPEGQVEHLIVEATSIHNLCQMYIGWGPFL